MSDTANFARCATCGRSGSHWPSCPHWRIAGQLINDLRQRPRAQTTEFRIDIEVYRDTNKQTYRERETFTSFEDALAWLHDQARAS